MVVLGPVWTKNMTLHINQHRLWQRLTDMAQIGATPAGGCNRQALSDIDFEGRRLFEDWCKAAGCTIFRDAIGNTFARRPGQDATLPPVMSGSHLDTQPTGGKFDGVYGVLAALEVIETLNDNNISTDHPIDIVVWTNEEGSRFDCAMMGSAAWSGSLPTEQAYQLADLNGTTVGDELVRLDLVGDKPYDHNLKAAFELHIEQGPILEAKHLPIGIVTGVQHMCRYRIQIHGEETHAGPSPMSMRRDPMMSVANFLTSCYKIAEEHAPDGRVTFGYINAIPGSPNTVPGTVELTLDLRHPDAASYASMQRDVEEALIVETQRFKNTLDSQRVWEAPGVEFDEQCISHVRAAAEIAGLSAMEIVSGAGHDACNIAAVAPTSMIFVPCDGGLSHNEAENISAQQAANGANVLLHTIIAASSAQ